MRLFIRRTLLFCLPMLAWFAVMTMVNISRMRAPGWSSPTQVLATGDSHIGCGIDTSARPGMRNVALAAEPILLSWLKLKRIAEWGRIDTVVLGFGPHNLSDLDHRRFKQHGWATDRLMMRLYPLVSTKEAMGGEFHPRTYLRTVFMQVAARPRNDHHQYIGAFSGLRRRFTANADSATKRHFFDDDGKLAPASSLALSSLDSIIAHCAKERIMLCLVSTPVHESYRSRLPREFSSLHDSLAREFGSRGVKVLLYSDLFPGDSLFADSDHLNAKGARLFTQRLMEDIRKR
ncbi:MAG: hypothetical protein IPK70_07030 [Flavobacteriales bacterium]|jgi:hypothetical protein|nr:hypothetical protein [Flavobacteriales bacterium]